MAAGFALTLAAAGSAGGQPAAHPHHPRSKTPAARHATAQITPGATMPIDSWTTLAAPTSSIAPARPKLDTTPAKDTTEQITVYARARKLDQDWRDTLQPDAPIYESSNSAAAQRLYAPMTAWISPEEQHVMSDAKDAAGLCGGLGGWITCPNK
jgi:hypothetical protein